MVHAAAAFYLFTKKTAVCCSAFYKPALPRFSFKAVFRVINYLASEHGEQVFALNFKALIHAVIVIHMQILLLNYLTSIGVIEHYISI